MPAVMSENKRITISRDADKSSIKISDGDNSVEFHEKNLGMIIFMLSKFLGEYALLASSNYPKKEEMTDAQKNKIELDRERFLDSALNPNCLNSLEFLLEHGYTGAQIVNLIKLFGSVSKKEDDNKKEQPNQCNRDKFSQIEKEFYKLKNKIPTMCYSCYGSGSVDNAFGVTRMCTNCMGTGTLWQKGETK